MDITKLQRVQNRLARIVTKSPPFTRSVPLLCSLHWLPVKCRILFKITLLIYKAIHQKQPAYLRSMLAVSLPSRSLRSNRGISLSVPRVRTNSAALISLLFSLEQPASVCPFSHFIFCLQEASQDTSDLAFFLGSVSLYWSTSMAGLRPNTTVNHSVLPQSPLMQRKHTAGCH